MATSSPRRRPTSVGPTTTGALFDLDGVITPTAEIHEHAWGELFAAYDYTRGRLPGVPRRRQAPLRRRALTFLASAGAITLARRRHPAIRPATTNVCATGQSERTSLFNDLLERDGIAPYPGSQATLDLLADRADIPTCHRVVIEERRAGARSQPDSPIAST